MSREEVHCTCDDCDPESKSSGCSIITPLTVLEHTLCPHTQYLFACNRRVLCCNIDLPIMQSDIMAVTSVFNLFMLWHCNANMLFPVHA